MRWGGYVVMMGPVLEKKIGGVRGYGWEGRCGKLDSGLKLWGEEI